MSYSVMSEVCVFEVVKVYSRTSPALTVVFNALLPIKFFVTFLTSFDKLGGTSSSGCSSLTGWGCFSGWGAVVGTTGEGAGPAGVGSGAILTQALGSPP